MVKGSSIFRYTVPQYWYKGVYEDKAIPCKAGRSFTLAQPFRPESAILIIHGYTGYPGEVVRPARDLFALGYDVYAPRLPGHGTSGKDFAHTDMMDWMRLVMNAVADLKEKYRNVYIAGHSMGGALAVIAAAEKDIEKTLLLAPAAAPADARLSIAKLSAASLFSKRKKTEWHNDPGYSMYYEDAPADDMYLGSEYWSWIYFRQLASLMKLSRKAMDKAPLLKGSVKIIAAGNDALVPSEWTDALYRSMTCGKELVTIPGATHYMLYDKDKKAEDEVIASALSFFAC